MNIGIFEYLPEDVTHKIFLQVHQEKMKHTFAFIRKYVPDPVSKPKRFVDYYNGPKFLRTSSKMYTLNPCYNCSFHNKHTTLEAIFVHNLITHGTSYTDM